MVHSFRNLATFPILLSLMSCGPTPPPEKPSDALASAISSVDGVSKCTVNSAGLEIVAYIHAVDALTYFNDAEQVVERIGQKLRSEDVQPPKQTFIVVKGPAVDRLGAVTQEPFMKMTFYTSDLVNAHFENLPPDKVLDLATVITMEDGAGVQAQRVYCSGPADERSNQVCLAKYDL